MLRFLPTIAAAILMLAAAFARSHQRPVAALALPEPPPASLVARLPGDHDLRGAPSISAAQIDAILASYSSPAAGSGCG